MRKLITIPGIPLSQSRPRLGRRGFCYDPRAKEKGIIKSLMREQWDLNKFSAAEVYFCFTFPVPKSLAKKNLVGKRHNKKPDVDNLIKLYLDCLTEIAWEDDCVVSIGSAVKIYGDYPMTQILIRQISDSEQYDAPSWLQNLYQLDFDNHEHSVA